MKHKIWRIIWTYIFTWILAFIIILPRMLSGKFSWVNLYERLVDLFSFSGFWIAIHVIFILCYFLLLAFFHFKKIYKTYGYLVMLKHIGLKFLTPILLFVSIYKVIIYANTFEDFDFNWDSSIENKTNSSHDYFAIDNKQRGMNVFGLEGHDELAINELVKNNIEWVAVVPFMFQKSQLTKTMNVPDSIGIWTPRDSSFMNTIAALQAKNVKVMLKPHLWMHEGWRSNVTLDTPKEWSIWFASYRKNMLHYAAMAEKSKVDLLCIGTELKSSLKHAPQQWITLVKDIKTIYFGKLTYAANWDGEFNLVPFWDHMDYIGVQGYFPLTKISSPELDDIKKGWDRHIVTLENLANTYQKPILFTEVGYRSDVTSTIRPWEWNEFGSILTDKKSNKTQQLAYEALFQKLWDKPWFAGTYIWQWDTRSEPNSSHESLDFTPRFKPALNTLAKWYGKPVKKNEN